MKRSLLPMLAAAHVALAQLGWATPVWATPVQAAPPATDPPTDDSIARAVALFDEGGEAFDQKRYEEARRAFEESFRLRESYDTAGLLGQTELKLGDYRSAATHIEYCLRHFPTGENRALYEQILEAFAHAKARVGAVRVSMDRAGAAVVIDGQSVGTSPLNHELYVLPGEHTLVAQTPDGGQTEERFRISEGEMVSLELTFGDGAAAPSVRAGGDASAAVDRGPSSDREWLPAYVGGGIAAASLVTSVVFRALASRDGNEVDRLRDTVSPGGCAASPASGDCAALDRAVNRYDTKAVVSNTTLAVGGAAAALTLGYVLYVLLDEPAQGSSVRASAGFDPTGGGVYFTGSF